MRVTIVAHDVGGVGGMERVLSELTQGLLDAGHHVTIVSRSCALPPHRRLSWARVPGPARPFPLAYPWFFAAGSLITWRRREGVLMTTGAVVANRADWSGVHLCHHAIQKLGTSRMSRQTLAYRVNAALAKWLSQIGERFCYRTGRTRGLIAVSRGVAAELAEHFPAMPVATVPNGVSIGRFQPNPTYRRNIRHQWGVQKDELLAVFVGSEWEGKGLKEAISALAHAGRWRLLVVGSGDVESYQAHADASGVGERVLFAGVVSDPVQLYCAGDAFLLPSIYESFSLVTYEAAACGLPLLVTPVSGVTELLVDGENGWYIEPNPFDIGDKLTMLGADQSLRTRMGSFARIAASQFSWQRTASAYQQVFAQGTGADPVLAPATLPGDVPAQDFLEHSQLTGSP